jgi:hypothetical protein
MNFMGTNFPEDQFRCVEAPDTPYTLQQKKLCMVKIAIFFQPWQITRWNKLLMKVHEIFQIFFSSPNIGQG